MPSGGWAGAASRARVCLIAVLRASYTHGEGDVVHCGDVDHDNDNEGDGAVVIMMAMVIMEVTRFGKWEYDDGDVVDGSAVWNDAGEEEEVPPSLAGGG